MKSLRGQKSKWKPPGNTHHAYLQLLEPHLLPHGTRINKVDVVCWTDQLFTFPLIDCTILLSFSNGLLSRMTPVTSHCYQNKFLLLFLLSLNITYLNLILLLFIVSSLGSSSSLHPAFLRPRPCIHPFPQYHFPLRSFGKPPLFPYFFKQVEHIL